MNDKLFPSRLLFALSLAVAGGVSVILLAFVWPSDTATLKRFPVALVAAKYGGNLPPMLAYADQDQFTISVAKDRKEAVEALRTGNIYAALVLGPQPEVLKATAFGAAVDSIVGQLASSLPQVKTTDVVPLAKPGIGFEVLAFPLVLGGLLGGIASAVFLPPRTSRLSFLVVFSALTGGSYTLILHHGLAVLPGSSFALAASFALAFFAIGGLVSGLFSVVGIPGLGLGAGFTLLVANPLSGAVLPPQGILPPWGEIGQLLAPGAAASLLRQVSFFPGADASACLWTLGCWSLLAIGLILLGQKSLANRPT